MTAMLIDGRFVAVFPRLVKALGGDVGAAAVLQAIHYRMQGRGSKAPAWMPLPLAEIAEEIGLSTDQTQRATKRLRDAGLLLVQGSSGQAREWAIDYDAVDALDGTDAKSRHPQPTRNRVATDAESRGYRREIASLSLYTEREEVIEKPAASAALVEVVEETLGQKANRITKTYTDAVPLSNFAAIAGVVRKAVRAGYDDSSIIDALMRLAVEGRSVTTDALRYELDGMPERRKPSGSDLYLHAAASMVEADCYEQRAIGTGA